MNKFHSYIRNVIMGLCNGVWRFPFSTVVAVWGTGIALYLVHHNDKGPEFMNILMTLALAWPLFVAMELFSEEKGLTLAKKLALHAASVLLLAVYYVWLPDKLTDMSHNLQWLLFGIGVVLVATFAAFLRKNERSSAALWRFNGTVIGNAILTGIWSGVIMAGISVALLSIDFLFDVTIPETRYQELAVAIFGLFSTTFFLSRVPKDFSEPMTVKAYPRELRLLAQYALTPLVTVYFLILYAYAVRILLMWEWPKGTLAYMILGFSMLGIMVYALLRPLCETKAWVRVAGNVFFAVLIPQVAMLFWALWFRVSEYGMTENRYFVAVLGMWLLAMAAYFLFSRTKDLRVITVSMALLAFLSSFGPWGALAVGRDSQQRRLEGLLKKNGLFADGRAKKASRDVPLADRKELSAIADYLVRMHGVRSLELFFGAEALGTIDNDQRMVAERAVRDLLGVAYVNQWQQADEMTFNFSANQETRGATKTTGFGYVVPIGVPSTNVAVDGHSYEFVLGEEKTVLEVLRDGQIIASIDIQPFIRTLMNQPSQLKVPQDVMTLKFANERLTMELHAEYLGGRKEGDAFRVETISGLLLFSLK